MTKRWLTRMLQLTWPSVAALLRGHAAEHQSLDRRGEPPAQLPPESFRMGVPAAAPDASSSRFGSAPMASPHHAGFTTKACAVEPATVL
jgi:hypothetical protein